MVTPPGPGNLPPMSPLPEVVSHGPGSGAPPFMPMPEVDPNGGLEGLPRPVDGGGFEAGFNPGGQQGGGIEQELLRRFMMEQGQEPSYGI